LVPDTPAPELAAPLSLQKAAAMDLRGSFEQLLASRMALKGPFMRLRGPLMDLRATFSPLRGSYFQQAGALVLLLAHHLQEPLANLRNHAPDKVPKFNAWHSRKQKGAHTGAYEVERSSQRHGGGS
jgi:hypothetical protein